MVVWVVGVRVDLDLDFGFELVIEVVDHHFLVGDGLVVDRNDLDQRTPVPGVFDRIHLVINSIDSIVRSHEAFELIAPIS